MTDDTKDKNAIAQPVRLGSKLNTFHQNIAKAANAPTLPTGVGVGSASGFADMSTTVIFPDGSGSMDSVVGDSFKTKVDCCQEAINSFLDNCFAGATKVGIASFPEKLVIEPTLNLGSLRQVNHEFYSGGSTPMADALDYVITEWPLTHGIVISDGVPDSTQQALEAVRKAKAKGVKLDAVHIGDRDAGGEEFMKQIAEITGGIYIKFTDILAFSKSFKFLTPKHRLQLTQSKNPVALLGAAEVKL